MSADGAHDPHALGERLRQRRLRRRPRRERSDRVGRRIDALAHLVETRLPASLPDVEALATALASLEKQIVRAGREQFKASTLAEAQRDQLRETLDALREAEAARAAAAEVLQERAAAAVRAARQEVARSVLPALDGLEAAIRSGSGLATPVESGPRRGWFRRGAPGEEPLRADLRAWLAGLEFVRERLLDALAAEGITPIPAQGLPFDPQVHLAAEVSPSGPDAPPGTVTDVIRTGYLAGGRVLRPAEVAVARTE